MTEQTSLAAVPVKVAVVDDDPSVLRSLTRLLRSVGFEVSTFSSAQQYLTSTPDSKVRCLILDVQMPGMSGFELHARLRKLGRHQPVVYMTAHDAARTDFDVHQAVVPDAPQAGAVGLLFKPFDEKALLDLVGKAMMAEAIQSPGTHWSQ